MDDEPEPTVAPSLKLFKALVVVLGAVLMGLAISIGMPLQ
jgi:hypothetical protein